MALDESVIRYSFPTKVRCPLCGCIRTLAYSTQGQIQYRKCLNGICELRFKIIGAIIDEKNQIIK